ncbi:MAG: glycosyl hydrolase 53 family protein [Planctomycetes bacterium]|nr:glycosyl hydrolase 53 family protein [Planctomycetota bacterium]
MILRCLIGSLVSFALSATAVADDAPLVGIDANYALDMAARNKTWKDRSEPAEPFELFAKNGCQHARIRLWVGSEGMNRLAYATQTARRAKQAGLKPYLVIFLSEDWADFVKQPAPAIWKNLPIEKKVEAVAAYCESVVRHMAKNGVDIDTFEIGNEIDFGICGEFEEEWPKRVSLEYMSARIWPRMIPILKAAQAGVLKAQPQAKFIVHLSQWNNVDYCLAFWKAMQAAEARLDYPGLSYFPTSAKEPAQRPFRFLQTQVARIRDALHKPVLLCEIAYPATADFGGQFADWKHAVEGYPLTEDGQAQWLVDVFTAIRKDKNFAGAFYWSPEWYDGGLWDAFALFDSQGLARPGVRSLKP